MTEKTTHVVVLGAGYAGLMAAMRLANKTDSRAVAITLVNATETFNERVRNHQLIGGQPLPERPLAQILAKTRIRFQHGTVRALQPGRQTAIVQTGPDETVELRYDDLIYALGSHVDVGSTPGAREHAYTLDDRSAAALAPLLPDLAARGGRVLLVGAGNTGVEVSTELAERFPDLRITVATRRSFATNLSDGAQRHIRKAFSRLGIALIENAEVTRLDEGQAMTAAGPIPFDVCIWVGGFAVSDLAAPVSGSTCAARSSLTGRSARCPTRTSTPLATRPCRRTIRGRRSGCPCTRRGRWAPMLPTRWRRSSVVGNPHRSACRTSRKA